MGSLLRSLRDIPTPTMDAPPLDQCRGKIKRTRADAERHAAYLLTIPGATPVETFACKDCGGWHVGSPMVKGLKPRTKAFKKRR